MSTATAEKKATKSGVSINEFHKLVASNEGKDVQGTLGISEERKAILDEWIGCENGLWNSSQETIAAFTKDITDLNELAYVMYYYGTLRPESAE